MSDDVSRPNETLRKIGTILHEFSPEGKPLIRDIESLSKKHINTRYAVIFNNACIKENLLPSFTNFRLYNRAVQRENDTLSFKRKLLIDETDKKKEQLDQLSRKLEDANASLRDLNACESLKDSAKAILGEILEAFEDAVKTRITRKLSALYGGKVCLPVSCDSFVNLSSYKLTRAQKDLLNLGLNCSYYPKRNQQEKKAELELLYEQICDHHKAGRIQVNPDVQEQLLAEGTKQRGSHKSHIVTPRLREAARELRDNPDLIIRRADKSSVFVLLNRADYFSKVQTILDDSSKFERLSRNPIEKVKKDLNKLISAANDENGGVKFPHVIGEYSPGYFYGNIKTHKPGNPIRPIIFSDSYSVI